jgi:aminoglycoside phosphotransferase (APT) family kinase protein
VVPSFLIFARREGCAPLRLGSLQYGGVGKIVTFAPSGHNGLEVVKRPRFAEDAAGLEREQELLFRFHPELQRPRRQDRRGQPVFVEPFVDGPAPDATSLTHQRLALRWLLRFQQQTRQGDWNAAELEQKVEGELGSVADQLREYGWLEEVTAGCRAFLEESRRRPLARVAEHGEFWKGNLILHPPDRLLVLDWQHFRETSEPYFDFFSFLFSHYCYGYLYSPGGGFLEAYRRNTPILLRELAGAYERPAASVLAYLPYFTVRYLIRGTVVPEVIKPFRQIRPFADQLHAWLASEE